VPVRQFQCEGRFADHAALGLTLDEQGHGANHAVRISVQVQGPDIDRMPDRPAHPLVGQDRLVAQLGRAQDDAAPAAFARHDLQQRQVEALVVKEPGSGRGEHDVPFNHRRACGQHRLHHLGDLGSPQDTRQARKRRCAIAALVDRDYRHLGVLMPGRHARSAA